MGEQLCLVWPVNNAMEPGDDEEQVSSLRSSPSEHTLSWHTPCPELGSADAILRVKVSPTSPAFQHTSRRIWFLVAATLRCPSGISAARRGGRGGGPLLSHHTTPHHTTPHRLRRASVPLKRYRRAFPFLPPPGLSQTGFFEDALPALVICGAMVRSCSCSCCPLSETLRLTTALSLSCSANDADAFAVT